MREANSRLFLVNFANGEPFEKFRKYNSWSGKHIGKADQVIEYSFSDIDPDYINEHQNIFKYKRGCGLWLWKPYFIRKALNEINDGDWLFYCDSGAFFIRCIRNLVECAESNGDDLMLFELPLLDRQFTKKDCYDYFGINDCSYNQTLATYILLKKTPKVINFINDWLRLCENERLISDDYNSSSQNNFDDYIAHREDQSLLSMLRIKNQINVYRDCSEFGQFQFLYSQYEPRAIFSPKDYTNSDFKTILLCNRKEKPIIHFIKYIVKLVLFKLGVFRSKVLPGQKYESIVI